VDGWEIMKRYKYLTQIKPIGYLIWTRMARMMKCHTDCTDHTDERYWTRITRITRMMKCHTDSTDHTDEILDTDDTDILEVSR